MSNFPETMTTGLKAKAITRAKNAMTFANAQQQVCKVMDAHEALIDNMRENYSIDELECMIDAAQTVINGR